MGRVKEFAWSALGAITGALLGALVWYVVLELVGVEGITRYAKEPVHQSYLWQVIVIYAGPFIGLLAGSAVGWRRGHVRRLASQVHTP